MIAALGAVLVFVGVVCIVYVAVLGVGQRRRRNR